MGPSQLKLSSLTIRAGTPNQSFKPKPSARPNPKHSVNCHAWLWVEFLIESTVQGDWAIRLLCRLLALHVLAEHGRFGDRPGLSLGSRIPVCAPIGGEVSALTHEALLEKLARANVGRVTDPDRAEVECRLRKCSIGSKGTRFASTVRPRPQAGEPRIRNKERCMFSNSSLILAVLFFLSTGAVAQETSSQSLVERGADAYVADGPEAAIKVWIAGSGLEGNTQALTQANMLRQIEDYYGKPQGIDIIKRSRISPRSEIIYFAVNYAKGIAYGRFQAYRKMDGEWISTEFRFHTQANEILPPALLYGD
jgi:hypothetical protein